MTFSWMNKENVMEVKYFEQTVITHYAFSSNYYIVS